MSKIINYYITIFLIVMMSFTTCYGASQYHSSEVIIFVSFSMPDASIKGWINEAEKIHAPVVVRGLVNNSFKQTLLRLGELTKDNRGGVQLDPTLFQRFQVTQVPAVVIIKIGNCPTDKDCIETFDIVYGDTHLDYALQVISNQKDEFTPIAQKLLTIMHGKKDA